MRRARDAGRLGRSMAAGGEDLPAAALRAADIGARHGYDRRNWWTAVASSGSGPVADSAAARRCGVLPWREAASMSLPEAVRHISVLGREAVDWLAPRDGGVYVDATFGAGGYSRAILDDATGTRVIGIDRDRTAIAGGFDLVEQSDGRLTLVRGPVFASWRRSARRRASAQVDGVVMDVGVSSMQLDQAERGFSFRFDGPLDMRMGRDGPSAADVIARGIGSRSRRHHLHLRRGAAFPRGRPRHRRRARTRRRSTPPGRWPISSRARGAQQARRNPSGDAHLPGAAHLRERRARRACERRWPPPSAC